MPARDTGLCKSIHRGRSRGGREPLILGAQRRYGGGGGTNKKNDDYGRTANSPINLKLPPGIGLGAAWQPRAHPRMFWP